MEHVPFGTYRAGSVEIIPSASKAWFHERQQANIDANGRFIREQTVSLGEARYGPSFIRDGCWQTARPSGQTSA
ncbi:MAG: hypothetical protein Rhims3KO_35180 [Hyphomicrobiales bacterium]